MRTQSLSLISQADGLTLSALLALPQGNPRGLVQIAHGMAEYKERYTPFLEFLTGEGYACLINDHRGHGASAASPQDLGWFGPAGARGLVEDLRQLTLGFQERFPGLPLCLFGHSMGSLAVRAYARRYGIPQALVVCGCPGQNSMADAGLALVKALTLLRGERFHSKLVNRLINDPLSKPFAQEGSPFAWLNSDPQAVRAYEEDPLCGFLFTLNGYKALLTLMKEAYAPDGWVPSSAAKVLFISGAEDPCMVSRAQLDQAAACMVRAGYPQVEVKVYPGMRHEILLEPGRLQVFQDVAAFLTAMAQAPSQD